MAWWKREAESNDTNDTSDPSVVPEHPASKYVPTFEPPAGAGWSLLGDRERAGNDVDSIMNMFDESAAGQTNSPTFDELVSMPSESTFSGEFAEEPTPASPHVEAVEPTSDFDVDNVETTSANLVNDETIQTEQAEEASSDANLPITTNQDGPSMADHQTSLEEAMQIDGALGVALVETSTGMTLGTAGNPPMNLDVAAAGNSSVVQAKLRTMRDLGLDENLEDILITLNSQYHIIRTLGAEDGLFMYLVLDKDRANLAMARFKLAKIEREIQI